MKNFRTYEIAMELYKACQQIKVGSGPLKNQFERASLSVILNLAEGVGRISSKDRRRFYSIAMGSLRETICLLTVLNRKDVLQLADKTAAHIHKLIQNPGGDSA